MRKFFLGKKEKGKSKPASAPNVQHEQPEATAVVVKHEQAVISNPKLASDTQDLVVHKQVAFVDGGSSNPQYSTKACVEPARRSSIIIPQSSTYRNASLDSKSSKLAACPTGHLSPEGGSHKTLAPSTPSMEAPRSLAVHRLEVGEPLIRSGTSMSQNTIASTASTNYSSACTHEANRFYLQSAVHYPNLAILATYSRDVGIATGDTGIAHHLTWSEITDTDLVENLGGRERTRQEVLFEMVCSEERYVQELLSFNENYLQPLLQTESRTVTPPPTLRSKAPITTSVSHHFPAATDTLKASQAPKGATNISEKDFCGGATITGGSNQATMKSVSTTSPIIPVELPIAAKFARRTSIDSPFGRRPSEDKGALLLPQKPKWTRDASGSTVASGTSEETSTGQNGMATSGIGFRPPPASQSTSSIGHDGTIRTPTSNETYLNTVGSTSNTRLDAPARHIGPLNIPKAFRHHLRSLAPASNKLHKTSIPDFVVAKREAPLLLPDDLRIVCQTITDQLLPGHQRLSERLRARYEEQYPLVRRLADVFSDQSWLIENYATYVLHFEKALEQVEETFQSVNPIISGQQYKWLNKDTVRERRRLAKTLMRLEEQAAMKGSSGLSICLSQPFQRLLKYPLLIQSLLYHTDPSMREYDETQKLAVNIDAIVRSIEDEKTSEEERARTRDCWARIEGVDDRALMIPRHDRLLVSEVATWAAPTAPAIVAARQTFSDAGRELKGVQEAQTEAISSGKAVRRISNFVAGEYHGNTGAKLPSIGSKRDVWLITFTDVVIRCRRVAVTKLPMGSALALSKSKSRGHIALNAKERNLYKFLRVENWLMEDKTSTKAAGVVAMDAVHRSRRSERLDEDLSETESTVFPTSTLVKNADGEGRMSFTYSNDELRPAFDVDPLVGLVSSTNSTSRKGSKTPFTLSSTTRQVVKRQTDAAAKFSNRVRPSIGESTGTLKQARIHQRGSALSPQPDSQRHTISSGFSKPTVASLARSTSGTPVALGLEKAKVLDPKRARATSSDVSSPDNPPASCPVLAPNTGAMLRRSSFSELASGRVPVRSQPLRIKHSSERLNGT